MPEPGCVAKWVRIDLGKDKFEFCSLPRFDVELSRRGWQDLSSHWALTSDESQLTLEFRNVGGYRQNRWICSPFADLREEVGIFCTSNMSAMEF